MTSQEKWERIVNPKEPDDYGLSISLSEMQEFPAGRAFLIFIGWMEGAPQLLKKLAENATHTLHRRDE